MKGLTTGIRFSVLHIQLQRNNTEQYYCFCQRKSFCLEVSIMNTIIDVQNRGGGGTPPSTGLTPDVLPKANLHTTEASSQTGVSTRYAHSLNQGFDKLTASKPSTRLEETLTRARAINHYKHWYTLARTATCSNYHLWSMQPYKTLFTNSPW